VKILLVVNSSASSVTARARVVIAKSLSADHELEVSETTRRGHATRLSREAARRGMDLVAVLGGDGTLNEAANGLVGTSTALGVLPGGSTNVFARTIGVANDPIEATGQLLGALERPEEGIKTVGTALAGDRHALFHLGVGYDAAVVAAVEARSSLKRYLGHAFFAFSALDTWARRFERKKPHFALSWSTQEGERASVGDGFMAVVLNSNPYTFLGERPLDLAPGTGLDDPLAVVVLRSLSAPTLLLSAARALRGWRLEGPLRRVQVVTGVVEGAIDAYERVPYQVDGDYLGDIRNLSFRWAAGSLRLVVPPRVLATTKRQAKVQL